MCARHLFRESHLSTGFEGSFALLVFSYFVRNALVTEQSNIAQKNNFVKVIITLLIAYISQING